MKIKKTRDRTKEKTIKRVLVTFSDGTTQTATSGIIVFASGHRQGEMDISAGDIGAKSKDFVIYVETLIEFLELKVKHCIE